MFSIIFFIFNLYSLSFGLNHFHQNHDSNKQFYKLFKFYHLQHLGELEQSYWDSMAKTELFEAYHRKNVNKRASNIIIFVGGGMGLSTITPARILKGQLENNSGEETKLAFENFPNTCLLKTYSIDSQVSDSASTATALLSGIKTNLGVTGVNAKVKRGQSNCETLQSNIITSIFDHAYDAGMSTGIVTNTRLTEATAAGAYASIADKDWEGSIPPKFATHPTHEDCKDIGRQLIENHPGKNLNVILGGGGRFFYPRNYTDPITGKPGRRPDGLDLVQSWLKHRKETAVGGAERYKFVKSRDELLKATEQKDLEYIFGIFNENHLNFDKERDPHQEASLEEMTDAAINVLRKSDHGFLLVVENGLIDLAHHENYANLALYETLALEKAVAKALKLISTEETLVLVTADHSQSLTMNGYQPRGQNIMGVAGQDDKSRKGFTTLIYSNGPGHKKNPTDPNTVDTSALRYQAHSGVYLESSHHTGEDVALYAIGPMSHIFQGTKEQTFVSHAMQFASCIGPFANHDHCMETTSIEFGHKLGHHYKISSAEFISQKTSETIYVFSVLNISLVLIKFI